MSLLQWGEQKKGACLVSAKSKYKGRRAISCCSSHSSELSRESSRESPGSFTEGQDGHKNSSVHLLTENVDMTSGRS